MSDQNFVVPEEIKTFESYHFNHFKLNIEAPLGFIAIETLTLNSHHFNRPCGIYFQGNGVGLCHF